MLPIVFWHNCSPPLVSIFWAGINLSLKAYFCEPPSLYHYHRAHFAITGSCVKGLDWVWLYHFQCVTLLLFFFKQKWKFVLTELCTVEKHQKVIHYSVLEQENCYDLELLCILPKPDDMLTTSLVALLRSELIYNSSHAATLITFWPCYVDSEYCPNNSIFCDTWVGVHTHAQRSKYTQDTDLSCLSH